MSTVGRDAKDSMGIPQDGPERRVVTSMSRKGISIGHCLQEALAKIESSSDDTNASSDTQESRKRPRISFDPASVNRIMQTFGEAVADSKVESDEQKTQTTAPRCLLVGRLDHYNRRSESWRIVVDNAKLRRRLPSYSETKRRGDKKSLWNAASDPDDEITLDQKVQILTYDDL